MAVPTQTTSDPNSSDDINELQIQITEINSQNWTKSGTTFLMGFTQINTGAQPATIQGFGTNIFLGGTVTNSDLGAHLMINGTAPAGSGTKHVIIGNQNDSMVFIVNSNTAASPNWAERGRFHTGGATITQSLSVQGYLDVTSAAYFNNGATVNGSVTVNSFLTVNGNVNFKLSYIDVYKSSVQSIPSGILTKVQFDTESFDTNTEYDNATNYRFTAADSGHYLICCAISWASGAGNYREVEIYKNGAQDNRQSLIAPVAGGVSTTSDLTHMVQLNPTQYIEIFVAHDVGANLNLNANNTRMEIKRIPH